MGLSASWMEEKMRIRHRYYLSNKVGLQSFLNEHQISYQKDYSNDGKNIMYVFDLYEDQKSYSKFKKYFPFTSLDDSVVEIEYTQAEIEQSEWLTVRSISPKMIYEFDEKAYKFSCPYKKFFSRELFYRHVEQIGELSSSKPVKWNLKQFFCGSDTADNYIFCADKAKNILGQEWGGLEFWPVKKYNTNEYIVNLNQLYFSEVLPIQAIHFTGRENIRHCNICGKSKIYIQPVYQLSLRRKYMKNPKYVYKTEDIWTFDLMGWNTFSLNIVSHEFYQLCKDNRMNRGMVYEPINLV